MNMSRIWLATMAGMLAAHAAGPTPPAPAAETAAAVSGSMGIATRAAGAAAKQAAAGPKRSAADPKPAAAANQDAAPACMHCGATCGLRPVCICEPATKKRPQTEFDATCEPLCLPACGGHPWPCGGRAIHAGCTDCDAEPCACASRVRYRKKIEKRTVDEEVPTIVRKVRHVCDGCADRGGSGCCGAVPRHRPPSWWAKLTWWWPRKAVD